MPLFSMKIWSTTPIARRARQGGFGLLAYLIAGIVLVGMLSGLAWKVRESGKEAVRLEWREANAVAEEAAQKLEQERALEARKVVAAQQSAERKARDYETKWRTARNALRDVPLALCPTPSPQPGNAPQTTVASRDGGIRLTYSFLRQYDGAWVSNDGQPLFGDPAGASEGAPAAGAPSTRGLDALIETHAVNAQRCSENSRQLGALVALIRKLSGSAD